MNTIRQKRQSCEACRESSLLLLPRLSVANYFVIKGPGSSNAPVRRRDARGV